MYLDYSFIINFKYVINLEMMYSAWWNMNIKFFKQPIWFIRNIFKLNIFMYKYMKIFF